MLSIARSLLGKAPQLVRALFFDKTLSRNWFVAWHQDRTVALDRYVELNGWRSWSKKDGVHHVQPPRRVLEQMVTIRLHACTLIARIKMRDAYRSSRVHTASVFSPLKRSCVWRGMRLHGLVLSEPVTR